MPISSSGIYHDIPFQGKTKQIMQRFLAENAAVSSNLYAGRRRPQPPRSLIAQPGSLQTLITWNSPQSTQGVLGYNIYKNNETNRVMNITDPGTTQATIPLPALTPTGFWISSYNAQQESVKTQVIASANSDELVASGTSGGTGGTSPGLPPGYPSEPTGGGRVNPSRPGPQPNQP